mgnify:CR=1 FL=1
MSLVFQAIMAVFMLPAHLAAASSPSAGLSSIVICTGDGFQQVSLNEHGDETGKQVPKPCPICDGIATSAFLLETFQTALIGKLTNPEVLRPTDELHPSSIACLACGNRGPPPPLA